MNPLQITTFINSIANYIAIQIDDDDELALVAAAFTQLGDTLNTILASKKL